MRTQIVAVIDIVFGERTVWGGPFGEDRLEDTPLPTLCHAVLYGILMLRSVSLWRVGDETEQGRGKCQTAS